MRLALRGFATSATSADQRDPETEMELNQLHNTIEDLRERSHALRGYL
jgi:hypothetical protein